MSLSRSKCRYYHEKRIVKGGGVNLVGKADMIFTSDINFASDHLFDSGHRARIFALFR